MKFIRYIATNDDSIDGPRGVCQLQYDEQFIQDIEDYAYGLSNINNSKQCELSLNVFGYEGIGVVYGDILNDDRAQGEFYEIEEGFLSDGLPDETSFSEEDEGDYHRISFNNLVVTTAWLTLIGYNESGDEVSAEILIDDLKPFV